MKAKTLQIVWHTKEPVYSIDFHPDGYFATAGGDNDVKIWDVGHGPDGAPQVRFAGSLEGHSCKTVNCVRFSHSGHCLASAGDRGEILLWRPAQSPDKAAQSGSPQPATPAASKTAGADNNLAGADAAAAAAGPVSWLSEGASVAWKISAKLRGHQDDVNDLAWAHDDGVLLSGGVENECVLFNVEKRSFMDRLVGHRHYVQGVAWDPLGYWVASQSADRTARIYAPKPPGKGSKGSSANSGIRSSIQLTHDLMHMHTLSKRLLPVPAAGAADDAVPNCKLAADPATDGHRHQQQQRASQVSLFHDEALNVFFRRMSWSPDGSLLALAAGQMRDVSDKPAQHVTYIYARGHWSSPWAALPCPSKASTVVAFCPLFFKRRHKGQAPPAPAAASGPAQCETPHSASAQPQQQGSPLTYRLVLAVATLDSVLLYDMESLELVMLAGPLHYAPITDMAWSRDGSCLAISSHDGYCSLLTFQKGELGEPCEEVDLPAGLQAALKQVAAAAEATAAQMTPAPPPPPPAAAAAAAGATAAVAVASPPQQISAKQQKAAVKRIQPQPMEGTNGSSPALPAAAAAEGQRRIIPSPVTHGATGGTGGGTASPRRVTPQPALPLAPAGRAAAMPKEPAAAAGAPSAASTPIAPQKLAMSPTTAAATPATIAAAGASNRCARRVTPQAVVPHGQAPAGPPVSASPHSQLQQAAAGKPCASAPVQGRVGLAAVQAAMAAAARKKAAAAAAASCAASDGTGAEKRLDDDSTGLQTLPAKRPKLD